MDPSSVKRLKDLGPWVLVLLGIATNNKSETFWVIQTTCVRQSFFRLQYVIDPLHEQVHQMMTKRYFFVIRRLTVHIPMQQHCFEAIQWLCYTKLGLVSVTGGFIWRYLAINVALYVP